MIQIGEDTDFLEESYFSEKQTNKDNLFWKADKTSKNKLNLLFKKFKYSLLSQLSTLLKRLRDVKSTLSKVDL